MSGAQDRNPGWRLNHGSELEWVRDRALGWVEQEPVQGNEKGEPGR